MFKDTKALITKVVDTTTEPIETFDQTVRDNPELVLPLAALHASVVVASIAAATAVICGAQQVRIAKEQTKQIRAKAMLEFHGKHHPGGHHGGCHGGHHVHHHDGPHDGFHEHHGHMPHMPHMPKRLMGQHPGKPAPAEV
ncbi:hypothetical protein [Lacticaseibacillus sp. GG6-2]